MMVKSSLHVLFVFFVFVSFVGCAIGANPDAADLAERVVIVVNERDPESIEIGRYYAERRGIPMDNIIGIDAPLDETISRRDYLEQIQNPLQERLFQKDWIQGMFSRLTDSEGRHRSMIEGHRISYLVLCRGIPLRIRDDPERLTPEMEQTVQKEFQTNAASVDSELALMLVRLPIIGFIQNPLYQNKTPNTLELNAILKVARLDGPTREDVQALVDHALEAERTGLRGRAYVDLTGPHETGDAWLRATADLIAELGFDLTTHESSGVFPVASRFDAPALYFGWYANDVRGPFQWDGFRFPAGAIAFHIHSFSARTVRSETQGWVGPLVSRGATVTLGNVYEPYLPLSHRPDLFLDWVQGGGNIGDAAAYSIPAFSWQGVLVGDPLYRPFAVSLEEQLGASPGDETTAYAVIRRMDLLVREGHRKEALEKGRIALESRPDLALAIAMAKMHLEDRDRRQAIRTLEAVQRLGSFSAMETMVAKEAADLLSTLNEHRGALKIYEMLLRDVRLSVEVRKELLKDGILLADRLNERTRTREWRAELSRL